LQIVFFAVLFGTALATMGERGQPLVNVLDVMSHVIFRIVAFVMKVAPIGEAKMHSMKRCGRAPKRGSD
jgi:aerobic C4-dicarboxylate transport protein